MERSYENQEDIQKAIIYNKSLEKPNWTVIAKLFNVNYDRFRARYRDRDNRYSCGDYNITFLNKHKTTLIDIIDRMERDGMKCRYYIISSIADFILREVYDDSTAPPPIVRQKWIVNFLSRYPDFRIRIFKFLSFDR